MAVSAKSVSLAAEIVDDLTRRGYTVSSATSSVSGFEGSPVITIGTLGAGNQALVMRVCQINPLSTDSLGLSITGFTPHRVQLGFENASGNAGAALAYMPLLADVLGAIMGRGLICELYGETQGQVLGEADLVDGKLKKIWYPDLKWKAMSAQ